jgi:hypothetical protein
LAQLVAGEAGRNREAVLIEGPAEVLATPPIGEDDHPKGLDQKKRA